MRTALNLILGVRHRIRTRSDNETTHETGDEQKVGTPSPKHKIDVMRENVLELAQPLLNRIKKAYGFDDDYFARHIQSTVHSTLGYLLHLPGTPTGKYHCFGGALTLCLEVGLHSLQAADGHTFGYADAQPNSGEFSHRWRLACFLAGFFHEMDRIFSSLEVVNRHGEIWPTACVPLDRWLSSTASDNLSFRWIDQEPEPKPLSVLIFARSVSEPTLRYLSEASPILVPQLLACIAGAVRQGEKNAIAVVVRRTASSIIDLGSRHANSASAEMALPSSLLYEVVRHYLASSEGLPNSPGSFVLFGRDGLFMIWPAAAEPIVRRFPASVKLQWGSKPDALLAELIQHGIAIKSDRSNLWRVYPPGVQSLVLAVQFAAPDVLMDAKSHVGPLEHEFLKPDSQKDETPSERNGMQAEPLPAAAPLHAAVEIDEGAPAEAVAEPPSTPPEQEPELRLHTAGIINPVVRDAIDAVIVKLTSSYDSMLASVHEAGVFIGLEEFIATGIEASTLVRCLAEANLLYIDPVEQKKVVHVRLEGQLVPGLILRSAEFDGWVQWLARWNQGSDEVDES